MGFPFIPLAAAAIGAGLGFIGGENQNEANAEQARLNREFQERMSNTQYQRGVADMRAAGLNPALAYQQGGASAPTGSSAPPMQNTLAAPASALSSFLQLQAQQAQIDNVNADTHKKGVEAHVQEQLLKYQAPNIEAQTGLYAEQTSKLSKENKQLLERLEQELKKAIAETDLVEIRKAQAKLDAALTELGLPEARANAAFYRGLGKYSPYVTGAKGLIDLIPGSLLRNIGGGTNSPRTIINQFRR